MWDLGIPYPFCLLPCMRHVQRGQQSYCTVYSFEIRPTLYCVDLLTAKILSRLLSQHGHAHGNSTAGPGNLVATLRFLVPVQYAVPHTKGNDNCRWTAVCDSQHGGKRTTCCRLVEWDLISWTRRCSSENRCLWLAKALSVLVRAFADGDRYCQLGSYYLGALGNALQSGKLRAFRVDVYPFFRWYRAHLHMCTGRNGKVENTWR